MLGVVGQIRGVWGSFRKEIWQIFARYSLYGHSMAILWPHHQTIEYANIHTMLQYTMHYDLTEGLGSSMESFISAMVSQCALDQVAQVRG